MSRKMVFKVMMSAFWRKSCDPQRPPLIQKIRFTRIGFFRRYIAMRCRIELIWGILWVCVNTKKAFLHSYLQEFPGSLLSGHSFVFTLRFAEGWDVSNMAFLTALVIVACVPWPNGIRHIFFMLKIMSKLATGDNSWLLAIGILKFAMAIFHADWFGVSSCQGWAYCNEMTWNMWRLPWKCVGAAWCPKSWQI